MDISVLFLMYRIWADMDVLRPVLININGRIYRKNTVIEEHYEDEEDFFYTAQGSTFVL